MIDNLSKNLSEKKERVNKILSGVKNLPSIPIVMMEVLNMISNERTNATDLGRVISQDQGLVAKILSVANSPFYGLPRRVSTIEFAIVILGFEQIKNIVIALKMLDAFKDVSNEYFDPMAYWKHSIVTAAIARKLSDDLGYHLSGEAFIAGLLHDLGLPVIVKYFTKEFYQLMQIENLSEKDQLQLETEIIGANHAEIGANLCERWNLPESLIFSILYHHKPSEANKFEQLCAITHLSDYISKKYLAGIAIFDDGTKLDEKVIEILKLGDINFLERMIEKYKPAVEELKETIIL
jgi:putative nucleotidyltransferase with HDIG domain